MQRLPSSRRVPATLIQTTIHDCSSGASWHTQTCFKQMNHHARLLAISRHLGVGNCLVWLDSQAPSTELRRQLSHLVVPIAELNKIPSSLLSEKVAAQVPIPTGAEYLCFPARLDEPIFFLTANGNSVKTSELESEG